MDNNGNDADGSLVDFGMAVINDIRNVLPQTDISDCFFYLSLNMWKHIERAVLQERYMSDTKFD